MFMLLVGFARDAGILTPRLTRFITVWVAQSPDTASLAFRGINR